MAFFKRVETLIQAFLGAFILALALAWATGSLSPQTALQDRYGPGLARACMDLVDDEAYCRCQVGRDLQTGAVRQWRYGIRLHSRDEAFADALLAAEAEDKAQFLERRKLHYADLDNQCRSEIQPLAAQVVQNTCPTPGNEEACTCIAAQRLDLGAGAALMEAAMSTGERSRRKSQWATWRGLANNEAFEIRIAAQVAGVQGCEAPLVATGTERLLQCPAFGGSEALCGCLTEAMDPAISREARILAALDSQQDIREGWAKAAGDVDPNSVSTTVEAAQRAAFAACSQQLVQEGKDQVPQLCANGAGEEICACMLAPITQAMSDPHWAVVGVGPNRRVQDQLASLLETDLESLEAERHETYLAAQEACAGPIEAAKPALIEDLTALCSQQMGQPEACACMVNHQAQHGDFALLTFWALRADPNRGGGAAADRWLTAMGVSMTAFGTMNEDVSQGMRAACQEQTAGAGAPPSGAGSGPRLAPEGAGDGITPGQRMLMDMIQEAR